MIPLVGLLVAILASPFKSKRQLEAENVALRHQVVVLRRQVRGRVRLTNFDRLFLVQLYRWLPSILRVLAIVQPETVIQSTVAKYIVKRWGPPSQGWRTFRRNHAPDIAAMDLFVVPTVGFSLLYAFVIVRFDRRALVWINVTQNPTAEWITRQLTEAFPWERHQVIWSEITIASMATSPCAAFVPWVSGTSQPHRRHLGRMALLNG